MRAGSKSLEMMQAKVGSPQGSSLFFFRITLLAKVLCLCSLISACANTPLFVRNSSTISITFSVWQAQMCPAGSACTSSTLPLASSCSTLADYQRTIQAFSILSVLGAAAAVAAVVYSEAPSLSGPSLHSPRRILSIGTHGVAFLMTLICWSLEAAVFNLELCGSGVASLKALGFQYSASFALELCVWILQLIVLVYTLVINR